MILATSSRLGATIRAPDTLPRARGESVSLLLPRYALAEERLEEAPLPKRLKLFRALEAVQEVLFRHPIIWNLLSESPQIVLG